MSLKDIDTGVKKIKSLLMDDIEKQLKLLGIGYKEIYTSDEIKDAFNENRKFKRKQILDVIMNECEESEIGLLLNDSKVREKNLKKFIRECAFDFTNKFCAIRLLEERNMISPTIKKFKEYGDKSEVQRNFTNVSYDLMDKDPYDGLKFAIDATLRELSTQIKVLFEVDDEHSLLFPDPKTLKDIVKILLIDIPDEDWKRDDFIGWVYQYFVEDEKDEINQADTPEEIAVKTQVYTYDWIVKYIVDNTLGAYWEDIKGGKRPKQSVETIKLIDPACGSGSFLTYSFDKFYEIYKEEGEVSEDDIPNYIISKNLYGLDIDERAIQLTALNLYIKAKMKNRNAKIDKFNIICTDNRIKEDVNIDRYLVSLPMDKELRETIKNIVLQAFKYMRENRVLGSLMKIEDVVNPLIDEYTKGKRRLSVREVEAKREKILNKQDQLTLFTPETEQLSLDSLENIRYFDTREEFIDYLRHKILYCIDYVIAKVDRVNDINSTMFAKDLGTGSNLITTMMQNYEIVVGNPPYLGNKKMSIGLREKLEVDYKEVKIDLYCTFIKRAIEIVKDSQYIGLLTPDKYLFTPDFLSLRRILFNNIYISKIVDLGKKVFKSVNVSVSIMISIRTSYSNKMTQFIDLKDSNSHFNDLNGKKYKTYYVNNNLISK